MKVNDRYSRQKIMPEIGEAGQERLRKSTVLIVGAGGLGSPVSLYLSAAGVGKLMIADHDSVNISNLNRQILYTTSDIGRGKTECAVERLRGLNPEIEIIALPEGLNDDNAASLIAAADIVVDCTDNFPARLLIDRVCRETGTPWIFGAVEGFCGQIAFFNGAGETGLTDLFADLDSQETGDTVPIGVVGATPGVVGSIQASVCIKYLLGLPHLPEGRLSIIDLNNLSIQNIDF